MTTEKTFEFPSESAYLDAWRHVRGMGYGFTYTNVPGEWMIRLDTAQEDYNEWSTSYLLMLTTK